MAILNEMIHEHRIVPLDGRPHLGQHSASGWVTAEAIDGNTLVVGTTNFSPKSDFRGASAGLHVVERFTRVDPVAAQESRAGFDP